MPLRMPDHRDDPRHKVTRKPSSGLLGFGLTARIEREVRLPSVPLAHLVEDTVAETVEPLHAFNRRDFRSVAQSCPRLVMNHR